jgi:hypothetical protein
MADDVISKRKQALVSQFEAERTRALQRYEVQLKNLERRKEADLQAIERRSKTEIGRLDQAAAVANEGRARLN